MSCRPYVCCNLVFGEDTVSFEMDVHEHTEQFHLFRLNSLCRICGGRSQKKQQKQAKESPMQCRNYAEDLKNVLGVAVSQDTDGTVCYSTKAESSHERATDPCFSHAWKDSHKEEKEKLTYCLCVFFEQAKRLFFFFYSGEGGGGGVVLLSLMIWHWTVTVKSYHHVPFCASVCGCTRKYHGWNKQRKGQKQYRAETI